MKTETQQVRDKARNATYKTQSKKCGKKHNQKDRKSEIRQETQWTKHVKAKNKARDVIQYISHVKAKNKARNAIYKTKSKNNKI